MFPWDPFFLIFSTMMCSLIVCRSFTPATMNKHRPYFSYAYSVVVITIFFYMAGEYALQQ